MDIDRSLDDIASEKKAATRPARTSTRPTPSPRTGSGPTRGGNGSGGGAIQNSPYNRPTPPRVPGNPDAPWTHDLYATQTGPRPSPGQSRQGIVPPASGRIVISNIHYEVTEADLKSIFQRVGTLAAGPKLRYDRSGRSMGVATAEYATPKSARDVINQFDGNLAKGQALQIKFDDTPIRRPPPPGQTSFGGRAGPGMPTPGSLLNRIDGGKSLGGDGGRGVARDGEVAGAGSGRGQAPIGGFRMGRGLARGTAGRGRGAAPTGRPVKSAPKTAEDLDKELEGYHGVPPANNAPIDAPSATDNGDVEMS